MARPLGVPERTSSLIAESTQLTQAASIRLRSSGTYLFAMIPPSLNS
nr:MAG TPA: hypothetical protein [Caudoviricetes sp.]